ncbi:HesA/MoeB/ThiF family protein [Ruania rhizosphaerae]|uniref:HesA/MoeB/ThiF family protein n=1 Tax=Ruania rhizosphaerae TaxID=1840413 RepID=UPI00135735F3|nr:ThiF family adenylyltransferase [Ruania rhizosphaerae]
MPIQDSPVWQITDEALAKLDSHLAVPTPERGAALLVAHHTRLVVGVLPDPVPGQAVSYWHSDQLNEALSRRLITDPAVRYGGTVHSHPSGMAWPSQPDHIAFRNAMTQIPSLREALFPIVVQNRAETLRMPEHYGSEHLVSLDHGTIAPYSGHPTPNGGMHVEPCRLQVMPLRSSIASALAALRDLDTIVRAGESKTIKGPNGGRIWVPFTVGDKEVHLVFPQEYPESPPWVLMDARPSIPAWDLTQPPEDRLEKVIRQVAHRDTDLRVGLEARLAHHLPARAPWKITIVGNGSVGSNIAEMLVRSGVKDLTLVDPDHVAPENLSRTVYDANQIGQPKVAALKARLSGIAPDVTISTYDDAINAVPRGVWPDADLVVMATDDTAAEAWLSHILYAAGVPQVSAKMFAKADAGEIALVVPDRGTACLRCATGGTGGSTRGHSVDYGSGRLVGELALGPDIVATCAQATKVVLATLSRDSDGPLADWINPLLEQHRTLHLGSTVDSWGVFEHVAQPPMDGPFASLWVRTDSRTDCNICGETPEVPAEPLKPIEVPDDLGPVLDALIIPCGLATARLIEMDVRDRLDLLEGQIDPH